MKKKYGLFKVLTVLLVLVIIATYFIDSRQGGKSYLALGDVFLNYLQSFYYFFDTALFILVVGGFYGLLNRIPAYKKMLKSIVNRIGNKRKLFVVIITILFALISSLTGFNVLLLLVIPMFISVILLLGYDKLVALSATIGSIVVGFVGGVFVTVKDPSSYYTVSYTTFDKFVGLDSHFTNVLPRIALFVIAVTIFVLYIINHIKKVELGNSSYELSKVDNLFVEVKDRTGKKIEISEDKKIMVWPLIVGLFLIFVFIVLGYFPWGDLFKIEIFNDFHTWLTGLKIGDYAVFTSLVSNSFTSFGTWGNLGNYMMAIVVVFVIMIILALVYSIKFEDAMDGFLYGMKKMLPSVLIVGLSYTVLVSCYNNGFVESVVTLAGERLGDNAIVHSLLVMLGSVLNVDLYYTTTSVFTSITATLSEQANLSVYAVMFQSLFGLVQLVGPTSILLLIGLSYLEVPYKTWLKYIWRFVVALSIVIFIALMVVSLL